MIAMTRAALFDVNHTLLAITDETETQALAVSVLYEETIRRTGVEPTWEEFRAAYDGAWSSGKRASFEEYRETRYESIVQRALANLGIRLAPDVLESVLQVYMQPLYEASYVIPGMRSLLEELSQRVRLGVITNYKYASGMRELLGRNGISNLLDAVAISSEVGWKKPAQPIYEAILRRLAVEPQECILVGDELEKDLWQASKFGMTTVLFISQEHQWHDAEFADLLRARLADEEPKCDYVAKSVGELRAVLNELVAPSSQPL